MELFVTALPAPITKNSTIVSDDDSTQRRSANFHPSIWGYCFLACTYDNHAASNMVSPFAIHQQQIAMLAQQQSLLMAAAAKSGGVVPAFAGNAQPPKPNGTNLPTPSWPNVGYQFPGMMTPAVGNSELQKYMQLQVGNMGSIQPVASSVPFPTSSVYTMGQNTAVNGVAPAGTSKTQSASPVSSAGVTQTGKEYDFSSLTHGMFSKS